VTWRLLPFSVSTYLDATSLWLTVADNDASKEVSTRPVNLRPSEEDSLSLAGAWLKTCLETHQTCPKPKANFKPSRIIEIKQVRGQRHLRLSEAKFDPPEPYAALSYCWGGDQHMKTTSKNILRHRTRINMQDLPVTVRDAILVADRLGILKVWVDAFCIIQDDQLDKA
jgi:hypothetical protein